MVAQLKKLAASLNTKQKITLAMAAVIAVGSLIAFTRWRRERDFRPLYSGLSAEDAGAVIAKLRESGVEFRLDETGGVVLAPSAQIAELRLQMASAGLPQTGRIGFELFDKTNFGVTEFAEHINYRRALEGELERSVAALAEVEQARVHITFPKDSVFLESRQPAKASVLVRLRPGAALPPSSVQALCQLIASAVEGLAPEAVAVLDMRGRLLSRSRRPSAEGEESSDAALDLRRTLERDLLAKIHSTLEPVVGAERYRAAVSVECDLSSGDLSEEIYDPTRAVMLNSQKTEDVAGGGAAAGVPGTASNLPRAASRPAGATQGLTRRTETISYQASRTVRRTRLPQGAVKRVSAAVLLDHNVRWEGAGAQARRVLEPPAPEKLKTIRDLVAAVTGFDAARGDQLIVESLPFDATVSVPPPETPAPVRQPPPAGPDWFALLRRNAVAAGIVSAVLLAAIAILVVLRKSRRGRVTVQVQPALPAGEGKPLAAAGQQFEARLNEQAALKEHLEAEALNSLKLPQVTTKKTEILSKHLGDSAKKDPATAAQILRAWLYDMEG